MSGQSQKPTSAALHVTHTQCQYSTIKTVQSWHCKTHCMVHAWVRELINLIVLISKCEYSTIPCKKPLILVLLSTFWIVFRPGTSTCVFSGRQDIIIFIVNITDFRQVKVLTYVGFYRWGASHLKSRIHQHHTRGCWWPPIQTQEMNIT